MRLFAFSAALAVLVGCGQNLKSKEKVQEAILDRLQTKSGLDLKALDVTTTAVAFDKNLAYATVSFHPKGDSRVNSGMVMTYTLENRDGKWVVVKVGDSHGRSLHGPAPSAATDLPPGHPEVPMDGPQAPEAQVPNPRGSAETR